MVVCWYVCKDDAQIEAETNGDHFTYDDFKIFSMNEDSHWNFTEVCS